MSDYQSFTNFILTDPKTGKVKNLYDDFGGIIINTNETYYERECMPQQSFVTDKNDTRDGEIFIKSVYGTRTIEMTCFFEQSLGAGDLVELKRWLGKKHQQIFQWDGIDDNSAIYVIEQGGWQSQVYYQDDFYGQMQFKFIAHNPYYFIKDEKDITFNNLNAGDTKNIRCAGNSDSYPLIKITPLTTSLVFTWNDLNVNLSSLTIGQTYYLDCFKNQIYYISNGIKTLCFSTFTSNNYYDFPSILCEGKNTLTISNGSGNFVITPNSRII